MAVLQRIILHIFNVDFVYEQLCLWLLTLTVYGTLSALSNKGFHPEFTIDTVIIPLVPPQTELQSHFFFFFFLYQSQGIQVKVIIN